MNKVKFSSCVHYRRERALKFVCVIYSFIGRFMNSFMEMDL